MTDFDPPLSDEELDFADMFTNKRRKREWERFAHECLAEWATNNPDRPVCCDVPGMEMRR